MVADEGTGLADAERAANAVVAAHPALRLRLRTEHGVWALRTEAARPVSVVRSDAPDPTAAADEAAGRLDPEAGDVIAFSWLEPTRTLVVTAHHLAVDAVSWLILLDDIAAALRGTPLPPPTTSYAEYARALADGSARGTEDLGHWITTLQAPPLLPVAERPREITVVLPPGTGDRVPPHRARRARCRPHRAAVRRAARRAHPDPALAHRSRDRPGAARPGPGGGAPRLHPNGRLVHRHRPGTARAAHRPRRGGPRGRRTPAGRARAHRVRRAAVPQSADGPAAHRTPAGAVQLPRPGDESQALHLTGTDEGSPYAVEVNAWTDADTGSLHAVFTLAEGVPDEITGHWRAALEHIADAATTAQRTAPVTPLQRGLFFQTQLAGPAGHYVAQSWFTFDRRLDTGALADAMAWVIARHPVVGAGFTTDGDGRAVQVLGAGRRVGVRTVHLAAEAEVDALLTRDRDTGFDPGSRP